MVEWAALQRVSGAKRALRWGGKRRHRDSRRGSVLAPIVAPEQAAWRAPVPLPIVAAPSGAARLTLVIALWLKTCSDGTALDLSFYDAVAAACREAEWFVNYLQSTRSTFLAVASARGEFAEWAEVHGNSLAGIAAAVVRSAPARGVRDMPLEIDSAGAADAAPGSEAVSIFIRLPSLEELERRPQARAARSQRIASSRAAWLCPGRGCGGMPSSDFVSNQQRLDVAPRLAWQAGCVSAAAFRRQRARDTPRFSSFLDQD